MPGLAVTWKSLSFSVAVSPCCQPNLVGSRLSAKYREILKATRSFPASPLTIASPFVGVPVEIGARIVQRSLRRQRVFQDKSDSLALSENILHERFRFMSEGIRYLIVLVGPYVGNATQRSRTLTVTNCCYLPWKLMTRHFILTLHNFILTLCMFSVREVNTAYTHD